MGYTGAADALSSGVSPSALGLTANAGSTAANTLGASQSLLGPVSNMVGGINSSTAAGTGNQAVQSASSGMTPYLKYGIPAAMMAYGTGMFGNKTSTPGITQVSTVGQSKPSPNMINGGLSPNYKPYFQAAEGGIAKLAAGGAGTATSMTPDVNQENYNPEDINKAQGSTLSSGTQALLNQYGINPTQATGVISALQSQGIGGTRTAAEGGIMGYSHGGKSEYHLGSYSDGGRLLKGPGDGMSDEIPATIAHKQPARLAEGEFVVPADVVSHLGNGSTDAGAKHLYKMMDNVRHARTGKKKQAKQIKAEKFLPKTK